MKHSISIEPSRIPSAIPILRFAGRRPQPDRLERDDTAGMAHSYPDYLTHLSSRAFAAPTIRNRRLALVAFIRWCQGLGIHRPREVTPAVLEGYRGWLRLRRKTNGTPLSRRYSFRAVAMAPSPPVTCPGS